MKPQRSIVLIPLLYVIVIIFVNLISFPLYEMLDIEDDTLRLVRLGSITNLLFYLSLTILYIVLFLPAWKRTFAHFKKHLANTTAIIVLGVIGMFVMMIAMGILYSIIGVVEQPENQVILEMQLTGPMFDRIGLVLFAVLLAPFVEEVMFRLAAFRLLKHIPGIPIWIVILLSSLLFGSIHVLGDDWIQILYYAGLGIILGFIYHKSNNIIAPIAVHMVFNAFVTITMFIGI